MQKLDKKYIGIPISLRKEDYFKDCLEFLYSKTDFIRIIRDEDNLIEILKEIAPEGSFFGKSKTGSLGYWRKI